MKENYYDGAWRPVTDHSHTALEKLRTRGFELGSDRYGKLMARWPMAPAAPLMFANAAVIAYWREEIQLGCAASLERLRSICAERGADVERTVEGLQKGA